MKNNPFKTKSYLVQHAEQLFTVYWQEMGTARSVLKLQRWCLSHSIVDPKTQNVPTRMGLWKVMWRWATENQDKAKVIWKNSITELYPDAHTELMEENWNKTILKNAKTAFQNSTHLKNYYKNMEQK